MRTTNNGWKYLWAKFIREEMFGFSLTPILFPSMEEMGLTYNIPRHQGAIETFLGSI